MGAGVKKGNLYRRQGAMMIGEIFLCTQVGLRRSIFFNILISLLLLLGCARMEKEELVEKLEIRLEHQRVKEHIGEGGAVIQAKIESTVEIPRERVVLHYRVDENWESLAMVKGAEELYTAEIPHQDKGTVANYYLEVTSPTGVKIYLPKGAMEGKYYPLTFKGKLSPGLLGIHIGLMAGAILMLLLAAFFAYRVIKKRDTITKCLYTTLIAAILIFLGGFPIGMAVEKIVFGTFWEGWPFGRDVTDTKTSFIFLYWLVSLFTMKGSLSGKPEAKNWISDKAFSYIVIIGVIITILLCLIPHENIKF